MRAPFPTRLLPPVRLITASVIAVAIMLIPGPAHAAEPAPASLNAADTALLNGVRLAGLWEIPAGQMAAERGGRPVVREIGQRIADQHVELDQLAVDAANKLGASIPANPTTQQQGWLNEMQNATGPRFDQIFVDRLRAAHGKIFPVIGAVRAGTRNPVVRKLADEANVFVMGHMQMLESTGLVRYDQLAPAALPAAQDTSMYALAQANSGAPANSMLLWGVLAGTLALAGLTSYRILARRR